MDSITGDILRSAADHLDSMSAMGVVHTVTLRTDGRSGGVIVTAIGIEQATEFVVDST